MSDRMVGFVKSADRVLDLFELLASRPRGLSHSEIADALAIPKSSLTQLVRNLVCRDYITFLPNARRYTLGQKFDQLVRSTTRAGDLIALAEPLLIELTGMTGESSALNIAEDGQLKVIATRSSPQRLVSHMRAGDLAPLHATSGGKAILAYATPASFEDYIAGADWQPITAKTITNEAELRSQLVRVRKDGIADVFEEFTPGIVGIAVPILSPHGTPLASFNVAMPAVRYSSSARDLCVKALRSAASAFQEAIAEDG